MCVCVLGWVKCREQIFTAGYTLYNYVCKKEKHSKPIFLFFTKPITDYGKMLKYREKYRSTDISVDLYSSHHFSSSKGWTLLISSNYYIVSVHRDKDCLFIHILSLFIF